MQYPLTGNLISNCATQALPYVVNMRGLHWKRILCRKFLHFDADNFPDIGCTMRWDDKCLINLVLKEMPSIWIKFHVHHFTQTGNCHLGIVDHWSPNSTDCQHTSTKDIEVLSAYLPILQLRVATTTTWWPSPATTRPSPPSPSLRTWPTASTRTSVLISG